MRGRKRSRHGIGGGSCTLWFDMRYLLFALAACSGMTSDPIEKPGVNRLSTRNAGAAPVDCST